MSGIDEAMRRFSALPGSSVGRGPRHPTHPDAGPGVRIDRFLLQHPLLGRDAGYVDFLQRYAGASIENEDASRIIDILGFGDASTDIEDLDGPIVDRDGYLMIAEAVYHVRDDGRNLDTIQHAFAYDVTGARQNGVYRSLASSQSGSAHFAHAFDGFESWLTDIIDREGWLDPPGRPGSRHV